MTTATTITPDTTLYTYVADFAGYTLEDQILGNLSAGQYAETVTDETEAIEGICDLMESYVRDGGFYLSEEDAKAADDENEERPYSRAIYRLIRFTPREAHQRLMDMAKKEAEYNA